MILERRSLNLAVDTGLISEFESLLESPPPKGRQKEQVVQDFLEQHTELIPTTNLLNHQLHFDVIVSKFPLGTELKTDYLYLTSSSDSWRITLVEIETPDKNFFRKNTAKVQPTNEFNAALDQVRSWKSFIDSNRDEVIRKLEPLLMPLVLRQNPIKFCYQLIIGRSQDKNLGQARRKYIQNIVEESGIEILSYDTLITWYREGQRQKKNVLRLTGVQFAFKYMHFHPTNILGHAGPDHLILSSIQKDQLRSAGYEIEKWCNGDLLVLNHKLAKSTLESQLKEGKLLPKA